VYVTGLGDMEIKKGDNVSLEMKVRLKYAFKVSNRFLKNNFFNIND